MSDHYEPSPEEIALNCARIRAGWSERTRINRIACDHTRPIGKHIEPRQFNLKATNGRLVRKEPGQ